MLKITAEISATNYKKLISKLRTFNRKQLFKVFDHYLVHVMEDKHVEELLKILESFERDKVDITAEVEDFPEEGEVEVAASGKWYAFTDVITQNDIATHRDFLDLMYDRNYFSYLHPDTARENANLLIAFAKSNNLDVLDHWVEFST